MIVIVRAALLMCVSPEQDLERARLIVDITRKREKMKRDYVRVNNAMLRIGMEDAVVVRAHVC